MTNTLITQLRERSRQARIDLLKSDCFDKLVNDIHESAELSAKMGYFKTQVEIPIELGSLDDHNLSTELCRRMNLPISYAGVFSFKKINDFVYLVFSWA